jgi:hypothetical protein
MAETVATGSGCVARAGGGLSVQAFCKHPIARQLSQVILDRCLCRGTPGDEAIGVIWTGQAEGLSKTWEKTHGIVRQYVGELWRNPAQVMPGDRDALSHRHIPIPCGHGSVAVYLAKPQG